MRQHHALGLVALILAFVFTPASPADSAGLSFENELAQLSLNEAGEVVRLADRQSGVDYVDRSSGGKLAFATIEGKSHPVTRAQALDEGRIRLTFGETGATAEMRIMAAKRYFVLELLSASAEKATSIDLINLPLTLKGVPEEPMAACALALNLQTNVFALPQAASRLQATAYAKLGYAGAKVAILLCPQAQLRDVMKEVVAAADELPQTRIGGPWALDAPDNRGSYILECTGKVGEAEIDRWIRMLRELGISQLDFHCGQSFRFGDYTPNPEVFPRGMDSVRAVTGKLHDAGMLAGFHTYAFFIAKNSPFVTPVPNPGLAHERTFTLAEALPADATVVPVRESTADVSAVTGFFVPNSATLRIGDELIIFKGCNKQAPFGFVECQRGAYGTKPAAHPVGAKVQHLKEMFGLFVPDPDSQLFLDVIDRTATVYNDGGFDMIYLDALDGSYVLGGHEWAWYYGSKFVFELAKRLKKPALFEMSTFHHHLWYVRSRMGAWDCPARGPKPFIEMHRVVNRNCRNMFLPPHLGWWAIFDWDGIQPERTTSDVIEYLGCKCIADGCGLSFPVGFTPDAYDRSPTIRRLGKIVRAYEDLRRTNAVPESVRQRLGTPGEEFTLCMPTEPGSASDRPVFRPVRYDKHKLTEIAPDGNTWTVTNRFGAQSARLRIEALLSAADYNARESVVIEDFASTAAFDQRQAAEGVSLQVEEVNDWGRGVVRLVSTRAGESGGTWAMAGRKHAPLLNLANKGLGFWVHGDGRGQLLNVQVKSPLHAYGGVCDRYVKIDFEGWRYIELIEPESDGILERGWPYMPPMAEWPKHGSGLITFAYPAFHIHVMYDQIESVNLWCGELPVGRSVCQLSPIKAIPLRPCTLRNPSVTIGGRTITFPVELKSGQYLEFTSLDDCKVFGPKGEELATVKPAGDVPELAPGENRIAFRTQRDDGPRPRAMVTVISQGDPL
ncbi:MAG TPA: hypothetical protein PL151_18290 [Phycisphaerae bacterium]|nr:hypothetical protein [Phycisphaerae bacterium]HOM52285.1 hypothetical protein [Phycisphaerae bacterium]HON66263.1 hypothetical protein [Phycisphaerae bacterium]HOQ84609.1 hypothetical protein [Phycisphaerae bacterium]HPP24931.1 hypothetical protein [Phycisphaerae bacterium]